MTVLVFILILWAVASVVYVMVTLPEFTGRPYRDQVERVEKVIMYIEAEPETTYGSGRTKEQVVARVLQYRDLLKYYERLAVANRLLDKHDPERLRLRIAELEQQLGIGDEQPDTDMGGQPDMGKRRNLISRRARGTG